MSDQDDYRRAAATWHAPSTRIEPHSLHLWQQPVTHAPSRSAKPDRFLIGLVAGAALFYWFGRAAGLGRNRENHV